MINDQLIINQRYSTGCPAITIYGIVMKNIKTIKIKLRDLNTNKSNRLNNTFDLLELITNDYLPKRLKEIETKSYTPFNEHYAYYRELLPQLNSGVMSNHLRQLDSTIKSYASWCKKKHKLVSFPKTISPTIPLRNDMFTFSLDETDNSYWDGWLKFLRINFPLKLCKYHYKQLDNMIKVCDSKIKRDNSKQLWLLLTIEIEPKDNNSTGVLGIDLGIAKPIVCSDGKQFGNGKLIKHKKLEFGKKRAKNQKLKSEITSKQFRWQQDMNHKLSKELIDYCIETDTGVLIIENLKGNHLSNRKFRKYSWAFRDLIDKIKYKGINHGIKVISVNPAYTSQTCSSCGLKSKDNRKSQSLFECNSCGLRANADVNAAKNILNLSVQNGLNMNPTTGKALFPETQRSLVVG